MATSSSSQLPGRRSGERSRLNCGGSAFSMVTASQSAAMSSNAVPLPQVLRETVRLLWDLSAQAETMAEQLQEFNASEELGLLNAGPVVSLNQRILDIKTDLSNTAEIIPKLRINFDIPWIGETRDKLRLEYVSGDDPWEFCLGYKNDHEQRQKIEDIIKEQLSKGLQNRSPRVGDFVVCHREMAGQHDYFRALVIRSNPETRKGLKGVVVYKLDTGGRATVLTEEVYCIPEELAFIPCRVIRCCLVVGEHQLKEKFCAELRLEFKDFLQRSKLTVDVLDAADDSSPPRFKAVVWGFNKNRGSADVNLNRFIDGVVIPRLKEIPPERSDAFEYVLRRKTFAGFCLDASERKTNVAVGRDRPKSSKPARCGLSAANALENPDPVQDDAVTSTVENIDEPDAVKVAASVEKVVDWIRRTERKVELTTPEPVVEPAFDFPRNKTVKDPIQHENPQQTEVKDSESEMPPVHDSASDKENSQPKSVERPPEPKPADILNLKNSSDSLNNSPPPLDKGNRAEPTESSSLSPSAPQFVPKAVLNPKTLPPYFIEVTNYGNDEDNYDGIITNLLDEYQPTDEKRICLHYQKNGFCGRRLCPREHVKKSSLWTTDKVSTYCSTFNDIDVPGDGEVLLTIQHVKTPVSFYATLPETYSETGESGALETSETLHNDLNSLESNNTHRLLAGGPELGELVLALGHQEFLGPRRKWLRSRVMDVPDEKHVEVFFLDFGNKEIVKTKDLREIQPRFLHLPPQAVLVSLYNLVPNQDRKEEAIKFLKDSIERKKLNAKVSSSFDDELDVLLYTDNGDCLNDVLVQKGFATVAKPNQG